MDGNQYKCQTDDSIDYKQFSIMRLPGTMAPGTTAFIVPLSCQSLVPVYTI